AGAIPTTGAGTCAVSRPPWDVAVPVVDTAPPTDTSHSPSPSGVTAPENDRRTTSGACRHGWLCPAVPLSTSTWLEQALSSRYAGVQVTTRQAIRPIRATSWWHWP